VFSKSAGRSYAPPLLLLAVLLTSCSRQPAVPAVERLAILRFENLSGDTSLNWMGRALSEIVASEVYPAGKMRVILAPTLHGLDRVLGLRPVSAPGISAEDSQALAAGATLLGYGDYSVRNGKLEVRLTLEDSRAIKASKVIEASAPAGDVLGAGTALARQISDKSVPYGTRSPQALEAYTKALESSDLAVREVGLGAALAADPDFVPPYRFLAEVKAPRDRAGAVATLEQALARGNISELDRARLELQSAELSGNADARQSALAKVVKLDSGDAGAWRSLGDTMMNRHDYRQAQQAYQKASALEPEDAALFNLTGYAAGQAGDLDAAMSALRRYAALRPNEPNPLDSMGDVQLSAGRFGDAENFYLQSVKKDPNFENSGSLIKAAVAHLLTGDVPGANNLAERYLAARAQAKDPIVDYRRAQWSWISGRRKAAAQQMGAFALASESGPLREIASRAYAELAVWSLVFGDRNGAASLSQKALSLAGPASAGNALVARFLSQPPASSSEWAVRAEQQFPGPAQSAIRNFALAYALLINQQFQPAMLLFRQMWENGSPTADEGLPVMLAWCYLETGRVKEAEPLLRSNPIPSPNGTNPYTGFYIPRVLYLRGLLAEKEGRAGDARAYYDKFLAVSGPDPLLWGEEKKVRQ
jgi:tetratricopeptide (TPR) repeat protein